VTPAETLTAAATALRTPLIPGLTCEIQFMKPAFGKALADWLDDAAHRQRATEEAATRTWANSDDTEARDRWIAGMTDQHALAVARALLGEVTG
jgi:dGTP triphosphohydrolase